MNKTSSKPSILESAWAAFEAELRVPTVAEVSVDGWRALSNIIEATGAAESTIRDRAKRKKWETKTVQVKGPDGKSRNATFLRPPVDGVIS